MKSSKLLSLLTALATAVLVLSGSIAVPILCRPFYYAHIEAMSLPEYTGLTVDQIKQAFDEMLDFCLGLRQDFSVGVLSWSESGRDHFADVRVLFQLDLVLLNNITTPEHPLGVFHPHAKLHHIKKENIGLIEVMGLAVLPSRLKQELFDLADVLVARTPVSEYPETLQKHAEWAQDILARHPELNGDTVHLILQDEVGQVFAQVLADAGVYKLDEAGRAGFVRFLASVK